MYKNKMNKTLSIIVPCYNSSKTVEQTIESLGLEKYHKDIQLILVNDGSTDNTLSIIKKWEKKYPEIICVLDKKNGNWGSVINESKKLVSGKYVRILDSDDQLNTSEIQRFIDNLKVINDDAVFTNFSFYNVKREKFIKHSLCAWFNYPQKNYFNSFDKKYLKNNFAHITIHSVTIKNEIFQKVTKLPEKIFYTDSILIFEVLKLSRTFCYIPHLYLYIYFVGQNDQSINISNFVRNNEHIDIVFNTIIRIKNPSDNKKHNTWTSSIIKSVFKLKLLSLSFNGDKALTDDTEKAMNEMRDELLASLNACKKHLSKVSYKTTIDFLLRFILMTKTTKIFNLVKIAYSLFVFDKFVNATK